MFLFRKKIVVSAIVKPSTSDLNYTESQYLYYKDLINKGIEAIVLLKFYNPEK